MDMLGNSIAGDGQKSEVAGPHIGANIVSGKESRLVQDRCASM